MTDTKTEEKKWTFTEPKKDAVCFADLKAFTDKDCKTAVADTVKVAATMKVGAKDADAKWELKTCGEKELVLGTGADYGTELKVDVSKADAAAKGKLPCSTWDANTFVTMTLSGWSDGSGNDSNASGAKSLAAAAAAGALAIAATQF